MKKKHFFILSVLLTAINSFSQKDGYWDKERATTKEIVVSARDRIVVKTDDLPAGTTEMVYRITLLDENQQLAGSLVSLLKAIPDPTGISQGSAGAVFIVSKISGVDKCKYAVFSNALLASEYKETGKTDEACLVQDNPVSKDARRLSMDKTNCLKSNATTMWFGFESKNWIMKQKIVLEVVPWVNYKLSRGWSQENRKLVISECKTSNLAKKLPNPDEFCVCLLEKMQKEYQFQEFQKLLTAEKTKAYKDFGKICFDETGASKTLYGALRAQAADFERQGKYGEAIAKWVVVLSETKGTAADYNGIGQDYLLTKQYDKAIKFLKEGEKLDDSELLIKLNLAHAYLLKGNFKAARPIYKKYQLQNVTDSLGWSQKIKLDFDAFRKSGIQSDDFDKVIKLIEK